MVRAISSMIVISLLCAGVADATHYFVYPDGGGDFPTLQAAIDGSAPGDTIFLGDGVFSGPGNRELVSKERHFRSLSHDPTACVIDAGGLAFGEITWGAPVSFVGIGFLHGDGFDAWYENRLTFENCRFESCSRIASVVAALYGGAIILDGCFVQGCGGSDLMYARPGHSGLTGCSFLENDCRLVLGNSLEAIDCTFESNTAENELISVDAWPTSPGSVTMTGCDFRSNVASICLQAGSELHAEIIDCTFWDNLGDCIAMGAQYDALLSNCSFVANWGADAADIRWICLDDYGPAELALQNCIFAHRSEGEVLIHEDGYPQCEFSVSCTDVYRRIGNGWTGPLESFENLNGNFATDPRFCDWPAGDLTLSNLSPCMPENNSCGVLIGAEEQGCTEDPMAVDEAQAHDSGLTAHPNPLVLITQLCFTVNVAGPASVTIHDVSGRLITTLLNETNSQPGSRTLNWHTGDLPSGMYLARLTTSTGVNEIKLTHLR